jgi:hypothetical protein
MYLEGCYRRPEARRGELAQLEGGRDIMVCCQGDKLIACVGE